MNKNKLVALLMMALPLHASAVVPPVSEARQIIDNMLGTLAKHKGVTFTMDASERLVGKPGQYNQMEMFSKVNVNPLMIYGKVLKDPNQGTELIFVTGQHDNKIRVNASKFLPTLTLAPANGMLTKNQHHTLLTSGFMIVWRIVSDAVKRSDAKGKFDEVFKYDGDVDFKGRKCYKILINDPTYAYTTATGQQGEKVNTMAQRLLVSEYHVMELNPSYRDLDKDVAGKTLKVPTSYAQKTTLYIDKATNMPLYQEMSDEHGIFEKYEYSNVTLNPVYKADEFTEKFPEYKF